MRDRRGRAVALATAAAAVLVIGVAALLSRDRLLVEWHLWRLESGDEAARIRAAERLGELRAVGAAPRLVQQLLRESVSYLRALESRSTDGDVTLYGHPDPDHHLTEAGRACKRALFKMGPAVTAAVLQGMLDERNALHVIHLSDIAIAVQPPAWSIDARQLQLSVEERVLTALRDDASRPDETRRLAALVLEKRYRR